MSPRQFIRVRRTNYALAEVFVFGTHFYRFPSIPIDKLMKDMKTLKELGFNTLKIQESWCIDNPEEGKIDLSEVESLVEEAQRQGLLIYFGVTMEQVPAWVWRKFPDCRLVNAYGERYEDPTQYVLPSDGKPGPCWHHPGLRYVAEKFMAEVARTIGKHDNIVVWNAWQEIGVWWGVGDSRPFGNIFCYCTRTLARFREWLRKKYGSLEQLNRYWKTRYGDWSEVEPPRRFMAVPSFFDWWYYMNHVYLREVVSWKARILKENDPLHRPVLAHVVSPYIGSELDWSLAKGLDVYGTSFYPGSGDMLSGWEYFYPSEESELNSSEAIKHEMWYSSLKFDYIRCAAEGKEYWAAEFQGGPVHSGFYIGKTPTPDDIRRWIMIALSTGIKGITFWNHRPEIFWIEGHGFGLCRRDGKPTDRAREAGNIGKSLQRWAFIFKKANVPRRSVAILVNDVSYIFALGTGESYSFNHMGVSTKAVQHIKCSIEGIYKTLWNMGVYPDFLPSSKVEEGDLKGYKVAILPFPIALSDVVARGLREFVKEGGILISEACPGRFGEYGLANLSGLAPALEEVFGVKEESVVMCREWEKLRWSPNPRYPKDILPSAVLEGIGPLKGISIKCSLWLQTYELESGAPILSWKRKISGVVNKFGKGEAYLIGTFFGHNPIVYWQNNVSDLIGYILGRAGVRRDKIGRLIRRRLLSPYGEVHFFINTSSEMVMERVKVNKFKSAYDLITRQSLRPMNNTLRIEVKPLSINGLVLEY